MRLPERILLGLAGGVAVGVGAKGLGLSALPVWQGVVAPALDFGGALFIRLITMIVIPLVIASIMIGVTSLGDVSRLGRIGAKTLTFYLGTTAVAVTIGLALATAVRPGGGITAATREALAQEFAADASARVAQAAEKPGLLNVVLDMVPANPFGAAASGQLLPLIVFVLIFGAAVSLVAEERRTVIVTFFHGVNDAAMTVIGWIMRMAPLAVFALMVGVTSRFGADVLRSLLLYALVVVAGLALHVFGTYSVLVAALARINPLDFFRRIRNAPLIAFSTSSSNATLPVTMETAEERLGVSKPISAFVLPLGATVNMDGTALYQGVATVFIAQVYGVDLGMAELATIVLTATLASVGAAGVPSAGIITLILVLQSVGLAAHAGAGIALVLGVDRILDMLRTAANVTGDLSCAAFVDRSERRAEAIARHAAIAEA